MDTGESLSEFLEDSESFDDIFSILQALDTGSDDNNTINNNNNIATAFVGSKDGEVSNESFEFKSSHPHSNNSPLSSFLESPSCKRQKLINNNNNNNNNNVEEVGPPRISHIAVERNRRKQMNDHLTVLRSLMPCFYVKRGDQASIIGGVINYINEMQQLVQALEAKKQRKQAYADVLSPRPSPKPPLSPRMMSLPVSPRTPQPGSPYKPRLHNLTPAVVDLSPCNSSTSCSSNINDSVNELVASSKSAVAEVEVKFCGPNLLLKTVSHRIPGQVTKIVSALEELELEILQLNINMVDEIRMLNSFTIKIGIECQLSAEELAQQIQQTFC